MTGGNPRAKDLFLEALDLTEEARADFLRRACGSDPDVHRQVVELLRLHDTAGGFLGNPTVGVPLEDDPPSQTMQGGLGRFELKRELGRGGFGQVHLAVRRGDVKQYVALKLLNRGVDTAAIIRRFRQERKFLAALQHEYIATFIDAGETDDGRPFYVMEYVDGRPIDRLCNSKRLPTKERLQIFLKVCAAVQLAHSKFVLHRDIKPSNILVTDDGTPKLVDFGIAKATNPEVWGTILTADDQRVMTYDYASPEQVTGDRLDVRSDVYSLGIVLYELLTGRKPYQLTSPQYEIARKVICDEEPLRPSDAVARTTTVRRYDPGTDEITDDDITPDDVARDRGGDLRALRRGLSGDLDNIVMFALRKDPDRRYGTVEQLAEDIRAYLNDEPLRYARPESRLYVVKKAALRHAGALVSASAVLIALASGVAVSTVMYVRAEERAEQLARVTEFQGSMLSDIDVEALGINILGEQRRQLEASIADDVQEATALGDFDRLRDRINPTDIARTMIDAHILAGAVRTIDAEFGDDPVAEAALRQTVGDTYVEIGMYAHAMPQVAAALEMRLQELGEQHLDTLDSRQRMGALLWSMGRFPEAERCYLEALDGLRDAVGPRHPDTLRCLTGYGNTLLSLGRHDEAESSVRSALEGRRETLGEHHAETLDSLAALGNVLLTRGRLADAEPYFRESLEGRRRALGPDHPDTVAAINSMGVLLRELDRLEESAEHFRAALDAERRVHGDNHPNTITALMNLGAVHRLRGAYDEAESYLRQAVTDGRRVLGSEHPVTLSALSNIGVLLRQMGNTEEAEPYYREVLDTRRRLLGADHPSTLVALSNLALFLETTGRLDEAEPLAAEALRERRRVLGDDHPDTLQSINRLAGLLRAKGRLDEVEPMYRQALDLSRSTYGDEHRNTLVAMVHMGDLCVDRKLFREAEGHYREAQALSRRMLGDDHPTTIRQIAKFGFLYESMGDADKARDRYQEALAKLRELYAFEHPSLVYWTSRLGACHRMLGDVDDALEVGEAALRMAEESLAENHPTLAFIRLEYGKSLVAASRLDEAERELKDAYEVSSARLGARHFQIAGAIDALVDLYERKGDTESAARWRARR